MFYAGVMSPTTILLARRLAAAFLSSRLGIASDAALRRMPADPGPFWCELARILEEEWDAAMGALVPAAVGPSREPAPAGRGPLLRLPLRSTRPS
jgi:hypothetical protein